MTHAPFHDAPQSDRRLLRSEKGRGKLILTLRTDKPEAEVGLYDDDERLAYETWPAHRELSSTIHKKIEELLNHSSISLKEVQGIVCYKGPGSFTGLRIGMSVANALAYSLQIPVVAKSGENWLESGLASIGKGNDEKVATPKYESSAKTSRPRR